MQLFDKIVQWQTNITPNNDKLAHFFWGFWYALIGYIIFWFTGYRISVILLPLILGVMNEIRNFFGKGKPEFMDIFYTVVTGIIIYMI
jgi:hypothetical protein